MDLDIARRVASDWWCLVATTRTQPDPDRKCLLPDHHLGAPFRPSTPFAMDAGAPKREKQQARGGKKKPGRAAAKANLARAKQVPLFSHLALPKVSDGSLSLR